MHKGKSFLSKLLHSVEHLEKLECVILCILSQPKLKYCDETDWSCLLFGNVDDADEDDVGFE